MRKRKGFFDDIEEPEFSEKETLDSEIGNADTEQGAVKESGTEAACSVSEKPYNGDGSAAEITGEDGEGNGESAVIQSEKSVSEATKRCGCKKKNIAIFSGLAVVLVAFVFVSIAYTLGLFNGKYSEDPKGENKIPEEEFYYYPADYETNIFTVDEYLALDRTVKYAPDSSQSYLIQNGDYAAEGEPGLVIIGEYLNAVIAGNHEKVNSLYTDKFIEENGVHEKFPPQKLFKIRIRNERVIEEKDGYTVYYFTVSYRIFRNDGLFRLKVDEDRERAQIFEVFVYGDETAKINLIKDRPGYVLDI